MFDVYEAEELGMPESEYYVEVEGGDIQIDYMSNRQGSVSLLNQSDESWLKLGSDTFSGDGSLPVSVTQNNGFKRRADLVFCTETRKDTVAVFQHGSTEERFYVAAGSMVVYNGTDQVNSVATDINVPLGRIETEVRYSGGQEWITDQQQLHIQDN